MAMNSKLTSVLILQQAMEFKIAALTSAWHTSIAMKRLMVQVAALVVKLVKSKKGKTGSSGPGHLMLKIKPPFGS